MIAETWIEVCDVSPDGADAHGRVSIAFEVDRVLEVQTPRGGLGGLRLRERRLAAPYSKDYDAIPGNRPCDWVWQFDVGNWGLLRAHRDGPEGPCVGGAVIAFKTPRLRMLEDRKDLALLWDLRVAPEARRRGVGTSLFTAAEAWSSARGCRSLKVETQNVNVPACRFYASRGCTLGALHRHAYPDFPDEVQLLWYKDLA